MAVVREDRLQAVRRCGVCNVTLGCPHLARGYMKLMQVVTEDDRRHYRPGRSVPVDKQEICHCPTVMFTSCLAFKLFNCSSVRRSVCVHFVHMNRMMLKAEYCQDSMCLSVRVTAVSQSCVEKMM